MNITPNGFDAKNLAHEDPTLTVIVAGIIHRLSMEKSVLTKEELEGSGHLLSRMPGLLLEISVKEGQKVNAGFEMGINEFLKMENVLRATGYRGVNSIAAKAGDSLDVE